MAWVAVGTAAVGVINGGLEAQITLEQGNTTRMIDNMNAGFEDIDAYHATQQGAANVARYQTTINQTVSTQRANQAANGVDVNFGTAADEQADTKVTGLLNALDLQNQARNKAYGIEIQANNTRLGATNAYAGAASNAAAQQGTALIQGANTAATGLEKSGYLGTNNTGYKT